MSATDELRRLLDERGVEWWPSDERWNADVITHWYAGLLKWTAIEGEDGLWVNAGVAGHNSLTPEQAVAATLGRGTCKVVSSTLHEYEGGYAGSEWEHELSCGHTVWWSSGDSPEWCPWCGKKVVDE